MLEDGREGSDMMESGGDMMEEEEYKDFGSDEEIAQDEEVFQGEETAQDEEVALDEEVYEAERGKDSLDMLLERVWITDPKNLREELYSVFIRTYVELARKNEKLREFEPEVETIRPYSDEYPDGILRVACCDTISRVLSIARGIENTNGRLLVAIGELILQLEKEDKIRIREYDDKIVCSIIVSIVNSHPREWSRIENPEESVKRLIGIIEGDSKGGDQI